jgi:hypothetical protein
MPAILGGLISHSISCQTRSPSCMGGGLYSGGVALDLSASTFRYNKVIQVR